MGKRTGLIVVIVLLCGIVVGLGVFIVVGGDDDDETVDVTSGSAPRVLLEPVSTATDPFAPPGQVGQDLAVTPVQTDQPTIVEGGRVGLYGGTMNASQCDKGQLTSYLAQNPDKGAAWATVLGITPADIPAYVAELTPVVLRSDTAVTNHGFVNGKATSMQSVLQAGTAVLVDAKGAPVTKCYCGNPLQPPVVTYRTPPTTTTSMASTTTTTMPTTTTTQPTTTTTTYEEYPPPTYYGPEWPTWTPTSITIIQVNVTVVEVYVLVDPTTGRTFQRPRGTDGTQDVPVDVATTTTTTVATPNPTPAPTPTPSPAPTPTTATTRPTTTTTYLEPTTTTTFETTTTTMMPEPDCVDEYGNMVPCG